MLRTYNIISEKDSFNNYDYFVQLGLFKVKFSNKLFPNKNEQYFYRLTENQEIITNESNEEFNVNSFSIDYQFPAENNYEKHMFMSGPAIGKYDLIITIHYELYTKFMYLQSKDKPKRTVHDYYVINAAVRYDYVWYEGHSYVVTKVVYRRLFSKHEKYKIVPYRDRKRIDKKMKLYICFDCETVIMSSRHQPYLLCATLDSSISQEGHDFDFKIADFCYELEDFNDITCSRAGEAFVEWIFSLGFENDFNAYEVIVFGYNNDNFDNNFIVDAFRSRPKCELLFSARYGKITEFIIKTEKANLIRFKDIYRFIPDQTLKSACDFYGVGENKIDVDIVAYNNKSLEANRMIQYFENEQDFKECLKLTSDRFMYIKLKRQYYDATNKRYNIYQLIKDYCIQDVKVTLKLLNIIQETYLSIKKNFEDKFEVEIDYKHIFDYISIPNMSFVLYKLLAMKNKHSHLVVEDSNFGNFILNAYYGGRTNYSILGKYNFVGTCSYYDVTSMYPLAMKALYPVCESYDDILVGDEVDVDKLQSLINSLEKTRYDKVIIARDFDDVSYFQILDSNPFIIKCNIYRPLDDTELIACFPPVANRVFENNVDKPSLRYTNESQANKIMTSQHVKALIFGGWHVEVISHEFNVMFLKTEKMFSDYIDFFGEVKEKAKDEGNKAKAKLAKGVLNYLYGKLCLNPISLNIVQHGNSDEGGYYSCSSFRSKNEMWDKSYHYIAALITSYSNWILFSTMYRLSKDKIGIVGQNYRKDVIYVDTDSILFDSYAVSPFNFTISEQIGSYDDSKADFNITWKTKYSEAKWIIVYSKKCYVMGAGSKFIVSKLKGLHKKQADLLTYNDYIKLLSEKHVFKFNSLLKVKQAEGVDFRCTSTYHFDIINNIIEQDVKKTLKLDAYDNNEQVLCFDENIYNKNIDNFCGESCFIEDNINYNNFLVFLFR
jgi:hypothetical protein